MSPTPKVSANHGKPGLGGNRATFEAARRAIVENRKATLAIVLDVEGSTYVGVGAIALFVEQVQVGWLSGGCLEPEIARRAESVATSGEIDWIELDTRDDEALFGGSALGCRGRLRLALLPIHSMQGCLSLLHAWQSQQGALHVSIAPSGDVACRIAELSANWSLPGSGCPWEAESGSNPSPWDLEIDAPPSIVVFGTGPEAPLLLPLLRSMGWMTTAVEQRSRWIESGAFADQLHEETAKQVWSGTAGDTHHAALVMQHNFELDLEALLALSENPPPFIGLLGPRQRQQDLFRLLPDSAKEVLTPRLHSPVGLDLGGRGPEAIALSIAAELQTFLHRR